MLLHKNAKFLLVEDEPIQSMMVGNMISNAGFSNITYARDGREAFALLELQNFDCIISDFQMPNMDGLELLAAVRQSQCCANVPFIFTSSALDKTNPQGISVRTLALELGAAACLAKPYHIDQLLDLLLLIDPE